MRASNRPIRQQIQRVRGDGLLHAASGLFLVVAAFWAFGCLPPPGVDAPTISPDAGTYVESTTVSISSSVEGATIRYTTDGGEPDASSPVYSAPISLSRTTTVRARSFMDQMSPSIVTSATFVITFTRRISVSSDGAEAIGGQSADPSISADGEYVAYSSQATNLVPDDTNDEEDVFVYRVRTGQTTRVSVGPAGVEADGDSGYPSISSDGRYVAFDSRATNLVDGDTNDIRDVFVCDRQTGQVSRVSVSTGGAQANGSSSDAAITPDGRYVCFNSDATNLVAGDTNGFSDIFVHDRQTGRTERVSVASNEAQADGDSYYAAVSADGRYVAFEFWGTNLVSGDTNASGDILVRDRLFGQTRRVSVSSQGQQGNASSYYPGMTPDGRYVAFESRASNLVTGDTNGEDDTFLHDRLTGQTTRVSLSSSGAQGNGSSFSARMSSDARFIVFESRASNLVTGDTNDTSDVFLRDRQTGQTTRISVTSAGLQADDGSYEFSISADGAYIAFRSYATNLVADDTNLENDVFLHSRRP